MELTFLEESLTCCQNKEVPETGILIAIEGIDGAGKTTQVQLLGQALQTVGEEPVLSKEPTDGRWGQKIRESAPNGRLPLGRELVAFIKDRRDHARETINPSLAEGHIVVLDRYFYSTIAYQGARGADRQELVERMKKEFPLPDIVFLLDADPVVTLARIANGRKEEPNEFERIDQLRAVREVFNWLAETDNLIRKIDGHQSIADVHCEIVESLIDGPFKKYCAKPYECECWPAC